MANVYIYHSGQPGIPQLTAAGGAGQLHDLIHAMGVTGFGSVTLDSLTRSGTTATATRAAGLSLADGQPALYAGGPPAIPIIIQITGSTNGWDGEYALNAVPGTTTCTFAVPNTLATPATGTITLRRAPAGLTRLAHSSNKSVWRFADTNAMPGYFMLDDSATQNAGIRLAESAAATVDYDSMAGLCPTVAQVAAPGAIVRKTDGAGANKSFVAVIWSGGMWLGIGWSNGAVQDHEISYVGAIKTRKAADGYPAAVIGNTSTPSTPGFNQAFGSKNSASQSGQWLQRTYSQNGTAIQFCKAGMGFGATLGSGYADPNPVDLANDVWGPLAVCEGSSVTGPVRGILPGLWDPVNSANRSHLDILAPGAGLDRRILLVRYRSGGNIGFAGFDLDGPW